MKLPNGIYYTRAGLIWIVAPFFRRPPCYLCRIRPARFELGDYPLCRVCFEKIERCRRITEGIESETADDACPECGDEHDCVARRPSAHPISRECPPDQPRRSAPPAIQGYGDDMITTTATARLAQIRCYFDYQHAIDKSKVSAIVAAIASNAQMPAILVVQDEGNGYAILDGHHRAEASLRLELPSITAWVVPVADYAALIDAEFGGRTPDRLSDLDDYIVCGDDTYASIAAR